MGEPTDSSGVHGGDEEGNSEKLEVEHGNVDGGVPTGWLMSSAEIRSPFYALFLFLASSRRPVLDISLPLHNVSKIGT